MSNAILLFKHDKRCVKILFPTLFRQNGFVLQLKNVPKRDSCFSKVCLITIIKCQNIHHLWHTYKLLMYIKIQNNIMKIMFFLMIIKIN